MDTDLDKQFSKQGVPYIMMLLWQLWEEKNVFEIFVDQFIVKQCEQTPEEYERDPYKLEAFFEMIVHRIFVDLTS